MQEKNKSTLTVRNVLKQGALLAHTGKHDVLKVKATPQRSFPTFPIPSEAIAGHSDHGSGQHSPQESRWLIIQP